MDIIALGGLLLLIFGLESARRFYYSSASTNEAGMATPMSERREGLERLARTDAQHFTAHR